MWIGLILIICTVVPALAGASVNAIVLQIVGWVLFIVGAIVRGKQKKEQRKLRCNKPYSIQGSCMYLGL